MTTLTVAELTQTTLDGTGVFDTLMRANKVHLEAEFSKGRIKGTEYATVYLGSLEAVMRSSLEFLLQSKKIDLEIQLMDQQLELVKAQTAQAIQQTSNLGLQAINIPKEGLILDGQKCKLDAEYDLLLNENLKTGAEITLLTQKVVTEKAQTTALGVDDNSVIGKQKSLYGAQTDGFKRDAEQKAASIMVGTWNARRMTNDLTDEVEAGLAGPVVKRAIDKLLVGVSA